MSAEYTWWFWPLVLFVLTFVLGILAVMAGVGGGVLFVPIVGTYFPFHIDFVRGAGLIVALTGALAAGPGLLRCNLANLRLAMPCALIASTFAIIGGIIGLMLSKDYAWLIRLLLGITVILIAIVILKAKRAEFPEVKEPDSLSKALGIMGIYYDEALGKEVEWKIHRTPQSLAIFALIGIIAGMFGLGAGWANVPVLNLSMGAPLKIATGTSKFLLSITDTSAAWVYINGGRVLPLITVPSVLGIMLGSFVGVRVLAKAKPSFVKIVVVAMLILAGLSSIYKGLAQGGFLG